MVTEVLANSESSRSSGRRNRSAEPGTTLTLRSIGTRHRVSASSAAHRRHALRRVRPAAGDAIFHSAEQLPRCSGNSAGVAGRSGDPRQDLYSLAADGPAGTARDLRANWTTPGAAAVDQPPGTISRDDPQLQPGARRGRSATATDAIQQGRARDPMPASLTARFQGNAAGFQDSLTQRAAAHPRGADRGLPDPRHAL